MTKEIKRPVPSATVILVREDQGQLQVYLLERNVKSRFMAGNYVFPGGKVDPSDRDTAFWMDKIDLSLHEISDRFPSCFDVREIFGYGIAAIRETFEESGVILTHPDLLDGKRHLQNIRHHEKRPDGDVFKKIVEENNLTLSFSSLYPWRHWITPELMKQRYTTLFFLAVMPEDQTCRPDNAETTNGVWMNPRKGLERNLNGVLLLSPPTLVTLHQLLTFKNLKEIKENSPSLSFGNTIMPRLLLEKGEKVILEPWDPQYRSDTVTIDYDALKNSVLPVEEAFSRLWMQKGIWKTIK